MTINRNIGIVNVLNRYIYLWEQLCSSKPTKSCGSDNIHPRAIREVKENTVRVTSVFNFSEYWYFACILEGGHVTTSYIRKVIDVSQIIIVQLASLRWCVKCIDHF